MGAHQYGIVISSASSLRVAIGGRVFRRYMIVLGVSALLGVGAFFLLDRADLAARGQIADFVAGVLGLMLLSAVVRWVWNGRVRES